MHQPTRSTIVDQMLITMLIIRLMSSVSIMMIILLITMLIIRLMGSDHNVVDPTMIALLMLCLYARVHLHTHKVFAAAAEALSGNLSLGTI